MYAIGMHCPTSSVRFGAMTWVTTGEPTIQRQRSRWVVRVAGYDAATGRRRVRQLGTHETKKAAVAHQRAIMDGRVGSDDETLSAYLREVWLPSKDERVEVGTYDQYRWAVEGHIVPLLGAVRLRDLTPEAVDRWVRALVVAEDGERARLSATSARLVRKILSMSMEDAVRRGRVPRNPVSRSPSLRSDPAPTASSAGRSPRREQFLDGIAGHRLYAAFHLALVTGVRRGELLGLRWEDVDLDAGRDRRGAAAGGRTRSTVAEAAQDRGEPARSSRSAGRPSALLEHPPEAPGGRGRGGRLGVGALGAGVHDAARRVDRSEQLQPADARADRSDRGPGHHAEGAPSHGAVGRSGWLSAMTR